MNINHLSLKEILHYAHLGEFSEMSLEDWAYLERKLSEHVNSEKQDSYEEGYEAIDHDCPDCSNLHAQIDELEEKLNNLQG